MIESFRATAAAHLSSCDVTSTEADAGGTSPHYMQKYQNAWVGDGDPDGDGSFRCLLTTATPKGKAAPPRARRLK